MITISNEQAKDLRNAFKCWQQDYDPVEDKEQYDMFGLGVVAMDELLALRKEREKAETVGVPDLHKVVYHFRDLNEGFPVERFKADYVIAWMLANYPPAPIVPDDSLPYDPQIAEYEQMMEAEQAQADTTSQKFESLAGKSVGGWIPCSERMPVEKDIVLVVDDGYFVCEAQYREGDFFSAARGNNEFFETICRDVEFWQPLPEPPCK
ncbi:DUF551 domain-containing protein [Cronobacter sakazakii]